MENLTFRSRLLKLVQKSRKAVRLYSTMERSPGEPGSDFREIQAVEWKKITAELLRELTQAMENPQTRRLVSDVYALRDRYYGDWRLAESELHTNQKSLVMASEQGDFTKAAVLSSKLIAIKARVQASQAAHHELNDVLSKSKVAEPTIELSFETVVEDLDTQSLNSAKVIPLRKKRVLAV